MLVVIDLVLGCTSTQDPETRLSLHFTSVGVSLDHQHHVGMLGRGERVPNSSSIVDDAGLFGSVSWVEFVMVLCLALVGKVGGSEMVNMLSIGGVDVTPLVLSW